MKKLLFLLLCVAMLFSLAVPALAAEGDASPTEFYVKYAATNIKSLWPQMASEAVPGYTNVNSYPRSFTEDATLEVDGQQFTVHCVKPTFEVNNLPSIPATSDYNSSANSLQRYVRDNLTYKQTNAEYDTARGIVYTEVLVDSLSSMYDATGRTYNITGTIGGIAFTTALKVTSEDADEPDVWIDTGRVVRCTPTSVEYSLNRRDWRSIRDGNTLPSDCSGETVYFRTPATTYTQASGYTSTYCKGEQTSPSGKLTLDSNSYSVWITNAGSFSGCEFSIDGTYYSSKTVWENLQASTSYTVYARYPSTRYDFASQPVQTRISTKEGAKTELTYNKVSTSSTVYMQASGTAALSISNKQMTATYTDTTVRQLKTDISNTSRKTDVVTTLDVYMTQEETDSREYNKVKFSMPSGMGLLQLRLHTPWFTVIRDSETTEVMLYEGVVDSNSTIKAWANGLSHVYKVTTKKTGEVTVEFPWEWPDRADLDGLRVSYISADGKDSRTLNYAVTTGGIKFTLPDNGYFAIRNLNRPYPTIPFSDSQAHWAYSYICHAYETGLVAGTSASTFDPDGKVTRSQLVMLLARMRGYDDTKWYGDIPYTDVQRNDWYAGALSFCYAAGIIKPDGTEFKPNATVTRQQTVSMAEKLFPYKGTLWEPFNCTDRDTMDTYALRPMDALYTCGIVNGTSDTTFSPNGELSRAEIVTILYRLQVADYWQTKTAVLKGDKLDSKLVKNTPNVWVDDGAKYFSKTSDIQPAMQYFQTTTGVRPYLVTTTTAKVAEDVYKSKFTDNGHMLVIITKLNDRGGVKVEFYVGSDAKTVITEVALKLVEDKFNEYWNQTTSTAAEAMIAFFRNTADDVMASEVYTNPTGWKAPQPTGDRIVATAEQPEEPAETKPVWPLVVEDTFTFREKDTYRDAAKNKTQLTGFSAWAAVDSNWEQSVGEVDGWTITLLHSKAYSVVRGSIPRGGINDTPEGIDLFFTSEALAKAMSMGTKPPYAGSTEDPYIIFYDTVTGSTCGWKGFNIFFEYLYSPPQSVVDQMLAKYK